MIPLKFKVLLIGKLEKLLLSLQPIINKNMQKKELLYKLLMGIKLNWMHLYNIAIILMLKLMEMLNSQWELKLDSYQEILYLEVILIKVDGKIMELI